VQGASSPPTLRVLDVLELVAGRRQPPTFSEIVRDLEMTQATAHSVLKTLVDRGWLVRTEGKSFVPGPVMASTLRGSVEARPLTQTIEAAAHGLAQQAGHRVSVLERVEHEVIVICHVDQRGRLDPTVTGSRLPFSPPFGVSLAAAADDATRRDWMERGVAAAAGIDTVQPFLRAMLEQVAHLGYHVERTTPAMAALIASVRQLDDVAAPLRQATQLLMLEQLAAASKGATGIAEQSESVANTLDAPVLLDRGTTRHSIAIHPGAPLSAEATQSLGAQLLAAADLREGTR
jgi:DNA-binding IclR family transcriptional regulator